MRRPVPLALLAVAAALVAVLLVRRGKPAHLRDIGPRLVTNESKYPVMLYGENFSPGLTLALGAPLNQKLATTFIDARHVSAVLPEGLSGSPGQAEVNVEVRLEREGKPVEGVAKLTVIDDVGMPTPMSLAVSADGQRIFAASPTTDEIWSWKRDGGALERRRVGDRPRAVATATTSDGKGWLLVAHEYTPELWLLPQGDLNAEPVRITVRPRSQEVFVDAQQGLAFVSSRMTDLVDIVDLATRKVKASLPAGRQPRSMALLGGRLGDRLFIGNVGAGTVTVTTLDGTARKETQPLPGIAILGGRTEKLSEFVIGGKAPRALVASPSLKSVFVASIGPNLGPNPQRQELSMNGGVSVLNELGHWDRHLAVGSVPSALALDETRHRLYLADMALGQVFVLDAAKLVESDAAARNALLSSLALPIPENIELIRPRRDFGVENRAGVEVHAGPTALALSPDGRALFVLSRYHGTVTVLDVSGDGAPVVEKVLPGPPGMDAQTRRRLGEIGFYADVGRTGVTCEACHIDGTGDGVLFEKNQPMRLYRVPTLRDVRETAPYFFPAMFPSLEVTAKVVGGRNRFHNPELTDSEVAALAEYQRTVTAPPNPYLGSDGAPPKDVVMPDGRHGDAQNGMKLFERVGCAANVCHPAPHFTSDQDAWTRGAMNRVGTPIALPIRLPLQEAPEGPLPVPSLTGGWDNFPLLASGAGGFGVVNNTVLEVDHPFALREVVERKGPDRHGRVDALTAQEREDLIAYLLTL